MPHEVLCLRPEGDFIRDRVTPPAALTIAYRRPDDTDNPLFALEGDAARRVLFTPHIAGVTRQASATLFREAWANVERVLVKGDAPLNRVY